MKRISKCRKTSNNYCPCGKKESATRTEASPSAKAIEPPSNEAPKASLDLGFAKSASFSNSGDLANNSKISKISRSKVYDFHSSNAIEKASTEPDMIRRDKSGLTAVNVIVPTTRKIFTPLKQDANGGASSVVSFTVDECEDSVKTRNIATPSIDSPKFTPLSLPPEDSRSKSASPSAGRRDTSIKEETVNRERKKPILDLQHSNTDKLPPASPLTSKRAFNKDSNSSIKMMIAHYNKLMIDQPGERRASEGSCWTPSLQKSPVLERRFRFENLKPSGSESNIRKCKSAVIGKGPLPSNVKVLTSQNSISKSSSAGSIHYDDSANTGVSRTNYASTSLAAPLQPVTPLERNSSFESILSESKLRNLRIQEAKNKFFNEYPTKITIEYLPKKESPQAKKPSTAEIEQKEEPKSTLPVEPESNFNLLLNKSISTGAIDDRTKTCNLPVCEKSPSKSKFGFSSITSKFRKVKMRRHKDPEMNAVSSLCRASLLINLDKDGKSKEYINSSKSCPSSPVMQRSISKRNSSSN